MLCKFRVTEVISPVFRGLKFELAPSVDGRLRRAGTMRGSPARLEGRDHEPPGQNRLHTRARLLIPGTGRRTGRGRPGRCPPQYEPWHARCPPRSEEHTSELQSHVNLVCRLLLEKKNKYNITSYSDKKKITNYSLTIFFRCY